MLHRSVINAQDAILTMNPILPEFFCSGPRPAAALSDLSDKLTSGRPPQFGRRPSSGRMPGYAEYIPVYAEHILFHAVSVALFQIIDDDGTNSFAVAYRALGTPAAVWQLFLRPCSIFPW